MERWRFWWGETKWKWVRLEEAENKELPKWQEQTVKATAKFLERTDTNTITTNSNLVINILSTDIFL